MKKLTLTCILGALAIFSTGAQNAKMTLGWDYPANVTNVGFHVYTSTNSTNAFSTWTMLLDVPQSGLKPIDTNAVGMTTYIASLSVSPTVHYFAVTAYDQWGESLPSNIVGTPGSPPVPANSRFLP